MSPMNGAASSCTLDHAYKCLSPSLRIPIDYLQLANFFKGKERSPKVVATSCSDQFVSSDPNAFRSSKSGLFL